MPLMLADAGTEQLIHKVGGSPELKKHLEDLYKAERQEKQFTFENVNDKDVAVAIDAVRDAAGYTYFRAFTNDLNLRNTYSWLDYQVKADTVEDYVNALKNPDVDNVVFEGQNAATMPPFITRTATGMLISAA